MCIAMLSGEVKLQTKTAIKYCGFVKEIDDYWESLKEILHEVTIQK